MTVHHPPISLRHAVAFAWRTFTQHVGLFLAVLLTFVGAWVALELVVVAGQRLGLVWWAAAHIAFFLVFAGLEGGLLRICLACYDGGTPTYADTFKSLAGGPRLLAGQLLYLALSLSGLALLVVPGVCLGVRYALFGFCLADGETTLRRSFQHSALLSSGVKRSLLTLLVALLVFNVLGASVLGIGLFFTVPLSVLTMTAVYRQLHPAASPVMQP